MNDIIVPDQAINTQLNIPRIAHYKIIIALDACSFYHEFIHIKNTTINISSIDVLDNRIQITISDNRCGSNTL